MQLVTAPLADIAQRINAENVALAGDLKTSLERAARIGALLLEAKAIVPHGKFREWMEANVTVGRTQASKYMGLAANVHRGGQIKGDSIRAAYVAVQAERKPVRRAAAGPKTKASKARLDALKEVSQQTYTASRLRACIRAVKDFPDEAAAEMELIEELQALLAGFVERASARPVKAA